MENIKDIENGRAKEIKDKIINLRIDKSRNDLVQKLADIQYNSNWSEAMRGIIDMHFLPITLDAMQKKLKNLDRKLNPKIKDIEARTGARIKFLLHIRSTEGVVDKLTRDIGKVKEVSKHFEKTIKKAIRLKQRLEGELFQIGIEYNPKSKKYEQRENI